MTSAIVCAMLFSGTKCKIEPEVSVMAAHKLCKVTLFEDDTMEVLSRSKASHTLLRTGKRTVDMPGHHPELKLVGSRIVVLDEWAGVAVFSRQLKRLLWKSPEDLLTAEELRTRPNDFVCHQEGWWLEKNSASEGELSLTLHSGRVIKLPVP